MVHMLQYFKVCWEAKRVRHDQLWAIRLLAWRAAIRWEDESTRCLLRKGLLTRAVARTQPHLRSNADAEAGLCCTDTRMIRSVQRCPFPSKE